MPARSATLGIATAADGDTLVADIEVRTELWLPGTDVVRTSVLVTLADVVAGKFADVSTFPRVCVTLDLDLHLLTVPSGAGFEAGRSLTARGGWCGRVDGSSSWVWRCSTPTVICSPSATPGSWRCRPRSRDLRRLPLLDSSEERCRLDTPLAKRVGLRRTGGGSATVPFHLDNINATRAIQGGLLALAAEEALLDVLPRVKRRRRSSSRCRCVTCAASVARQRTRRRAVADGSVSDVVDDEGRVGTLVTVRLAPA